MFSQVFTFLIWQTFSHFFYHKWRRPDCMLCSARVYIPRAVAVLRISGPGIEITCGALVWSIYIFSCDFFQFFLRHWAPPGLSRTQGLGQWSPGSPGPPKTATVPVPFWVFPPVHAPKFGESPMYGTIWTGSTHTHAKPHNTVWLVPHFVESPIRWATFATSTHEIHSFGVTFTASTRARTTIWRRFSAQNSENANWGLDRKWHKTPCGPIIMLLWRKISYLVGK